MSSTPLDPDAESTPRAKAVSWLEVGDEINKEPVATTSQRQRQTSLRIVHVHVRIQGQRRFGNDREGVVLGKLGPCAVCDVDGLVEQIQSSCARPLFTRSALSLRAMQAAAFGRDLAIRAAQVRIEFADIDRWSGRRAARVEMGRAVLPVAPDEAALQRGVPRPLSLLRDESESRRVPVHPPMGGPPACGTEDVSFPGWFLD